MLNYKFEQYINCLVENYIDLLYHLLAYVIRIMTYADYGTCISLDQCVVHVYKFYPCVFNNMLIGGILGILLVFVA